MRRPLILAIAVAATLAFLPAGAAAKTATCHGLPVTTTKSKGLIIGTPKRDVIRLTGRGVVRGRGGDDVICGSRFADRIHGGPGDDVVLAGAGGDRVWGGPGEDHIFGEAGNDAIDGGPGRDVIVPGAGRSTTSRQSGDLIVPGTYAVSIVLTQPALDEILESDSVIGLSRSTQFPIPVAATAQPFEQTGFSLGNYGIAVANGPIFPGAIPMVNEFEITPLGTVWSFAITNVFLRTAGAGTPGAITVTNQSFDQVAFGVVQSIAPFGLDPSYAGIFYNVTEPQETAVLTPTPTVAIYLTETGVTSPLMSQLPVSAATAQLSAANPTAAFTWTPGGGRFVTD